MYLATPRDSYVGQAQFSCKFLCAKIMKFIILIMIFIHDVYKFIPTHRLTLSGYPIRETIHQIGVA